MTTPARALLSLVLVLAVGCVACVRCGTRLGAGEPIERHVPVDASLMVLAPSIDQVGSNLRRIERLRGAGFLARLLLFPNGQALTDSFMDRIGLDLRDPRLVEKAGVDAKGPAAFVRLADETTCLYVSVQSAARFEAHVAALARRLDEEAVRFVTRDQGAEVVSFRAGAGGDAVVGYAEAGAFSVLCPGIAVGHLPRLARLPAGEALSEDPSFRAAVARRRGAADVWTYLPEGTALLEGSPFTSGMLGGKLGATEASLDVDATWGGAPEWLEAFTGQPSVDLDDVLPDDAVLRVHLAGNPRALALAAERHLEGPTRVFSEVGFDWRDGVFDQVLPGITLGFSLNRTPSVWRMAEGDPRYRNRFRYFHLSAAAALKDPSAAVRTLEWMSTVAPSFGAQVGRETRLGRPVFRVTDLTGDVVAFGVVGPRLYFAAPVARLDALLGRDGGSAAALVPAVEGLRASLDFERLVRTFRAMPEDYFGVSGPTLKVAIQGWHDALGDLRLGRLSVRRVDQSLQAHLVVELVAAPAPP